jgi:hypothetical protein
LAEFVGEKRGRAVVKRLQTQQVGTPSTALRVKLGGKWIEL